MDEAWLRHNIPRFEQEYEQLSYGVPKMSEIESFMERLGRKQAKRGKEIVWKSSIFPTLRPISSMKRKSKGPSKYTMQQILDDLQAFDIREYQLLLERLIQERQEQERLQGNRHLLGQDWQKHRSK